jgi:hypothetical protein
MDLVQIKENKISYGYSRENSDEQRENFQKRVITWPKLKFDKDLLKETFRFILM